MTAIPATPVPGAMPVGTVPLVAGPAVSELDLSLRDAVPLPAASLSGARSDAGVRVLLVEELAQVAAHIKELLFEDEHVELMETVHEGHAAMERITTTRPDVVIIDALLQGKVNGLQVARQMRESGLGTPIVFMTVPDRPVTLNEGMGIAEALVLPFGAETLLDTIVRVDEAHRGPTAVPPAGTIAVFSAKGGVGRTTIAHNLAVALDQLPASRTVLVDGDQVHGDLRLHLEAPDAAPSLMQLPTGHVTETDVAPLLWQDAAGVSVLLAPPRMEQADLIMRADIRNAISILGRLSDVVVIDVPTVMDDTTLAMLDDADVVLDIMTTERGAVRKAQRCHAVLTAADFPMHKVMTVVNQADPGGTAMSALAAGLGRAPDASLPYDQRLAGGGLAAGSALVSADPAAPLSRSLMGLAQLLSARLQGETGRTVACAA